MASQGPRPRSNTSGSSNSRRPKSRASTASAHSASTQPMQSYQSTPAALQSFPSRDAHTPSLSYTPEEMITRSEQQLINPNQSFAIDPSLHDQVNRERALTVDYNFSGDPSAARSLTNPYHLNDGKENQPLENVNEEQAQDDTGTGEGRKKKGSASSIANDLELRRLFRENQGRLLKDVAAQVLANERGPKSEKTKQIFAMLWLFAVCKKSSSSVPRNRVFSHYATRCGTERVPPLNPASFGKLVRIIFPGIQTRRLGMRGESKYHYVDLSLIEDQQETIGGYRNPLGVEIGEITERPVFRRQHSQIPVDTAVFPSPNISYPSNSFGSNLPNTMAPGHLYLDPAAKNIHQGPSSSNMVQRELKFSIKDEMSYHEDDPITLPNITKYLPVGTDVDSANSLTALYRSHCISVIDCFRFCKEKMLWYHFTSFHGTLTVPSQKLLADPAIVPWIKECDWLMYQRMIRFVAPLALQVVPVRVIDTFRAISTKLVTHISNTFQNLPQHVRDAKLGPAVIFAGLLDRLLRVNATAHAAANMLTNDANRDQMWHDWVMYVKPIRVVESGLPGCGYTRVLHILSTEIRDLLGPLSTTTYMGMDQIFANAGGHATTNMSQHAHPETDDSSTEGVLDRWTNFLESLPSRFPGANARLLLHCVGEIGSAALRDITMAQALSFGSWWVTKVWVDEMLQWLAEKGGFMEGSPKSMKMRGKPDFFSENEFAMDEGSDILGGSRPRTAVSESIDPQSRFGSVDVGSNYHREHSRTASVSNQPFKHPEGLAPSNIDSRLKRESPASRHAAFQSNDNPSKSGYQEDNIGLGISHSQLQHAEHRQASSTHVVPEDHAAAISRVVEMHEMQTHDDSGIGMGLEDEDLSMAKYGGFVAGGINGSSDPADVIVC